MPYIQEERHAGNIVIVKKYHTYRYNSDKRPRRENYKKTTEQQQKINDRRSAENIVLYACENFEKGDLWVRLGYYKGQRPENIDAAHSNLTKLTKKLKRKDKELKYIGATEEGNKGGLHHHLLLPAYFDINKLIKEWDGPIDIRSTYTGELSQLASYLTKGELNDQLEDDECDKRHKAVKNKKITKSANLRKPSPPKKKIVKADSWREDIKSRKINGCIYDLKNGSVCTGITADGYPYQKYILIKRGGYDEYKNESGRVSKHTERRKRCCVEKQRK